MKHLGRYIPLILITLFGFSCENRAKPNFDEGGTSKSESSTICQPSGPTEVFAVVDGTNITEKDLDGRAKGMLSSAKAELYEKQKKALDTYLISHLGKLEADRKKISSEELMKQEVDGKIKKVSDREIKSFYDEATKGAPPGQVPPLDKVKDRIKEKLEHDAIEDRKDVYFSELKKKYKVAYKISRPKVDIALGTLPVKGSNSAPVTLVTFSDYQCPFCKRVESTLDKVMKDYRGKVKMTFRDFPLSFHPNARPAAHAARCAAEQGKFWEYHDKLFEKQELSPEKYEQYAKELGLNVDKFKACNTSNKFMATIDQEIEDGSNLGVTGTPAFFINGVFLSGALPYEQFKKVIDEEVASARSRK